MHADATNDPSEHACGAGPSACFRLLFVTSGFAPQARRRRHSIGVMQLPRQELGFSVSSAGWLLRGRPASGDAVVVMEGQDGERHIEGRRIMRDASKRGRDDESVCQKGGVENGTNHRSWWAFIFESSRIIIMIALSPCSALDGEKGREGKDARCVSHFLV